MRWMCGLFLLLSMAGCDFSDRGLSKLQVVDDLSLGATLDEVKDHWYLYSKNRLQVDQIMSAGSDLTYRAASRDAGVISFYLFFDSKTKILRQAEWRYHSSMTEAKEKELLAYWSKKLWMPSLHQRWGGHVYVWSDRRARLELYIADGICHLIHSLK